MGGALHVVLKEEVQRVLDHFSSCFDIRVVLQDTEGQFLRVGRNTPSSDYCRLIQSQLYGMSRCISTDAEKQGQATAEQRMLCYRCHAGLREAVKPIQIDGRLVGYAMIGQFRLDDQMPAHVLQDWKERVGDVDAIKAAHSSLTHIPPEKLDDILGLFSIMVEHVIAREMIALRGSFLLDEALAYIKDHVAEPITLAGVARFLGKHPSSLSRLFRKARGSTFKQVQLKMKIECAEGHMRSHPDTTVQETARRVGFDDPFYFSRVYRRFRGEAPSAYLARQRS